MGAFRSFGRNPTYALVPDLLTDTVIFAYALWTIACHATILLEGNVRYGLTAGAISAALCFVIVMLLLWKRPSWRDAYFDDLRESPCFADVPLSNRATIALLILIPLVVITWLTTRSAWFVWIEIVIGYCGVSLYGLRIPTLAAVKSNTNVYSGRIATIALVTSAFICMGFTLIAFRPRSDEGFYSSLAVSVVNYPDLALMKYKTLHGPATQFLSEQLQYPPYRVHSFELLGGYLSYLTGFESINIVHLFIAPFFALFAPFAIARLLKVLTPRYWLAALLITLSFYFIEGSGGRGFANQAFIRFFNGKSVMLTVAVPLVFAYGLRFGSKPTVSRFILLACSQISTVGMSSTGIWLAPLIATISVAVAVPTRRDFLRTMGLSLLSSVYVLLLGLWVARQMHVHALDVSELAPLEKRNHSYFGLLNWTLPQVFGNGWTFIAHLSSIALACVLARNSATWRLFAALGLLLSVGLANPFFEKIVQNYITGRLTYERLFWILPVPVAFGIWSTNLFNFINKITKSWIAFLVLFGAIGLYYWIATERLVISKANDASFVFPPTVKMWPKEREVARRVCTYVQNDKYVLAPKGVSTQLITMSKCGIPLISEMRWMSGARPEIHRRNKMVDFVTKTDIDLERVGSFDEWLHKYSISCVVTTKREYRNPWLYDLLQQGGFKKAESVYGFRIWLLEKKKEPWTLWRARHVAKAICKHAQNSSLVLAPLGVSLHLHEIKECAKPLIAYESQKNNVKLSEKELRRLDDLISRKGDLGTKDIEWFTHAVENNNVGCVTMFKDAFDNIRVKKIINDLGFKDNLLIDNHLIMIRESPDIVK
jgi:hypothetical protein